MPRLLHTADWHLGRRLEGRSRHDEQVAVLDEICAIADREEVDAVLIAGDIYDSYNPPAEAERLYYSTIVRLVDGGRRPVVVIAGNHDSPDRLRASDPYGRALGVVTLGYPDDVVEGFDGGAGRAGCIGRGPSAIRLRLASGEPLNIIPLPYPSEARLGRVLSERLDDERAAEDYERAVGSLLEEIARECFVEGEANIVMSHLFVGGGSESESERKIQVGGVHPVHPTAFPEGTSYVALGHLHRPQQFVGRGEIAVRYAGSPLCYSFSEAGQKKGVTIVELDGGVATVREVPLNAGRPLIARKGLKGIEELEEFLDELEQDVWATFSVTLDEALGIGYIEEMYRRHPNLLAPLFDYSDREDESAGDREPISSLPVEEQFDRYLASQDAMVDDDVRHLFTRILNT